MYSSTELAKKYFKYYLSASNRKGHGMHSPFVFDFILNVLNNRNNYVPPSSIEQLRKQLLNDGGSVEIEDLGAGSRINSSKQRTVAELAKTALKSKKYGQLLYRLVKHYQPKTIVELGTSLGITTSYFSVANPNAHIATIEGSKSIAQIAKENFTKLNCGNIQVIEGNFDDILPSVLSSLTTVDLGYIDGNHRYAPTVNYFNQFLPKTNADTILIFDDIHWSKEMEAAWEEIKNSKEVQYTIDVFFLGFVFFKKEFKAKQDFKIRF